MFPSFLIPLFLEQRKALKKARKTAERKKARQEAKKFNHFSTVISSAPTVPSAPIYDPEAAPIQHAWVNPLARQNRMNPSLLAPPRPEYDDETTTSKQTTEEATTEETTATEVTSQEMDRHGKKKTLLLEKQIE